MFFTSHHANLIPQWPEAKPGADRLELLARLIPLVPQRYDAEQELTLQRQIRNWRLARIEAQLESAEKQPATKPGMAKIAFPGVHQNG
jgi:hypothetical protein